MALENIDLTKFEKLFSSMERQLIMQSSFLESIYNINVEEREDRISRENALDVARSETRNIPDQFEDIGRTPTINEEQKTNIFSSILGMIPGVLSGISLAGVGSLLISGGMIAIIAPAIGNFVEGFIKTGLAEINENLGLSIPESFMSGISSMFGDAIQWTIVGKALGGILGKRFGLIFSATGFIYEQFKKWLDPDGNNEIEGGFLEGFSDATTLAGIGTAIALVLGLALPKLITKALPGILSSLAIPNVLPTTPTSAAPAGSPKVAGQPRPGPTNANAAGAGLLSKNGLLRTAGRAGLAVPALSGVAAATVKYSETGDVSAAVAAGGGALAGAIIGGAIGTLGGPIGTLAGQAIGSYVGEWFATSIDEWASTPTESAAPPIVGSYTSPQPGNRASAFKAQTAKEKVVREAAAAATIPSTYEDQLAREIAFAGAEGFAIPTQDTYVPTPAPTMAKVDQLEQRAAQAQEKQGGTMMNSVSNPTNIGGATHITNNNATYNVLSSASQGLDYKNYVTQ